MKKFTFVCLSILLLVALLVALSVPVLTQTGANAWNQTAMKVLREGILYPEPADFFVFFDEFFDYLPNDSDQVGYINTLVSEGTGTTTITVLDESGGILRCINAGNEDDGANVQWHAETFIPATTKDLQFEARVKLSEYIQSDFLIGLVDIDTDVFTDPTDGIFFLKSDGDSIIYAMNIMDTTNSDSLACKIGTAVGDSSEFVDNTWKTLGFEWNKVDLNFYIDGYLVATTEYASIANIPTDAELTPTIAFLNGAAAVESLYVDYFWTRQER